jgi:hypothetical protein
MNTDPQNLTDALALSIRALSYEAHCVQCAAALVVQRIGVEKHDAIELVYFLYRAALRLDSAEWQAVAQAMCRPLGVDWQALIKASGPLEGSPPQ